MATKQVPSRTVPMRVLTPEQRRFIDGGAEGPRGELSEGLRVQPSEGLAAQEHADTVLLATQEHASQWAEGPRGQEGDGLAVQDVDRAGGRGVEGLSPRTFVERADGRQLRRIQLYFAADVAKRLKHHCVEHDVDMSAFVNRVVQDVLAKLNS